MEDIVKARTFSPLFKDHTPSSHSSNLFLPWTQVTKVKTSSSTGV
jgi:hypothetical protein